MGPRENLIACKSLCNSHPITTITSQRHTLLGHVSNGYEFFKFMLWSPKFCLFLRLFCHFYTQQYYSDVFYKQKLVDRS